MTVFGEGRMVRHVAIETQPAEPSIGQVQMHFLAESTLRPYPEAVADDEHADHQLGIN